MFSGAVSLEQGLLAGQVLQVGGESRGRVYAPADVLVRRVQDVVDLVRVRVRVRAWVPQDVVDLVRVRVRVRAWVPEDVVDLVRVRVWVRGRVPQGVVDLPPLGVERPRRVGARQHGGGLVGEDDVAA